MHGKDYLSFSLEVYWTNWTPRERIERRHYICYEGINRPFPHSTSVRTNNCTIARLGWTFSYIYCIFVHPNLDSVLLFVGMRERSIIF